MARLYHQASKKDAAKILREGLLQGAGGERRAADDDISRGDALLNRLRSPQDKQRGLDRERNVYCYMAAEKGIVDITSGAIEDPAAVLDDASQTLLAIDADPAHCFVSDLDRYDSFMQAAKNGDMEQARKLGREYWRALQSLQEYAHTFRRPEVIVTCNVPPEKITRLTAA